MPLSQKKLDQLIREQDDRNSRLSRPTERERKKARKAAVAAFACDTCQREVVVIAWKNLGATLPTCRSCGGPLAIKTACLTKGVLPRGD